MITTAAVVLCHIVWLTSEFEVKADEKQRVERTAKIGCKRAYNSCPKWIRKTGPNDYWVLCKARIKKEKV